MQIGCVLGCMQSVCARVAECMCGGCSLGRARGVAAWGAWGCSLGYGYGAHVAERGADRLSALEVPLEDLHGQ